jgi:hypothetical protein
MKPIIALTLGTILIAGAAAQAQDQQTEPANSAGCGVGALLFEGKQGIAPQILANLTNNTYLTNTSSITSGTAGCNSEGVVTPPAKVRVLVTSSLDNLARDVAKGDGEALESLADAITVDKEDRSLFRTTMKNNFGRIFPTSDVTGDEVWAHIHAVMSGDEQLRRYVEA